MTDPATSQSGKPLTRYRNRDISSADIVFLRKMVAEHGELGRERLSRVICETWDWRQANGSWAGYACRDLLLRLEEWGHLTLPVPTRRGPTRRKLPLLTAALVPLGWVPIEGDDVCLDELTVRPIAPEERAGWRLYIERYHYLGWRPIVGEHLLYAALLGSELVALIGWASAALHNGPRDRYLGWDEPAKHRGLSRIANNVRFLVLPWVRVKHLASKVLAANLRRLSRDWESAWGHSLLLAETFVDQSRFVGTCYRASNWLLLGQTRGRSKHGNKYVENGVPKAVFVYPLHRRARRLCSGRTHERGDAGSDTGPARRRGVGIG